MENTNEFDNIPQEQPAPSEGYTPRPAWQVWGARIGLVIFLIFVALQILQIARGGML